MEKGAHLNEKIYDV